MDIFVSWSGQASREVAELIRDWLPNVLQDLNVWVSSRDIEKGDRWASSIVNSLAEHDYGMVCVTKSNVVAPWIMFEAGALSKAVKARLIPVLCDAKRSDVAQTPLGLFQNIFVDREDFLSVIFEMNARLTKPLSDGRLQGVFDKWWADFETAYAKIRFDAPGAETTSSPDQNIQRMEKTLETVLGAIEAIRRDVKNNASPLIEKSKGLGVLGRWVEAEGRSRGLSRAEQLAEQLNAILTAMAENKTDLDS